jgi:AbrB family looped-hinge helix DNA binding protein
MANAREFLAKLSSGGRVVIPAEVRKRLRLSQGSVLRFWLDESGVCLLETTGDVRRLKGRLTAPTTPVSVKDMNRAVAEQRGRFGGAR